MAKITLEQFCADAGMLLRDQPRGTAARVTQDIIAWWNGRAVSFAFLRDDNAALIEEEFVVTDLDWEEWAPEFEAWRETPVFQRFAEVDCWVQESPPYEAGSVE
ncbi:hypothetical protein [Paraburkholderia mimosarum]|uniref:hypothetical protein n=1 Tax=Paraburkholderia mimosarum TaxID=312026 RepID=UPI0012DC8162|nr:hypothetical protein [Paraburkholderia mimosarum]